MWYDMSSKTENQLPFDTIAQNPSSWSSKREPVESPLTNQEAISMLAARVEKLSNNFQKVTNSTLSQVMQVCVTCGFSAHNFEACPTTAPALEEVNSL